jgi:hypothetical protein
VEPSGSHLSAKNNIDSKPIVPMDSEDEEKEQCLYCLQLFPICQLINHVEECRKASSVVGSGILKYGIVGLGETVRDGLRVDSDVGGGSQALEQCQFCLQDFPLNQLVDHSLQCNQHPNHLTQDGITCYSQDSKVLERCMFCFKDFLLSQLASHMMKCNDSLSGPKERFANFIPSVHELDSLAMAGLTETQQRAVNYVLEQSQQATERVLPSLRKKSPATWLH